MLSLAFIGLSFIYLIVALIVLNMEKNRLKKRYSDLKERFKDILIDDDINKILRNDSEFNNDRSYFRTRRNVYTVLWILTLLVLLITVISLSNYQTWQTLRDAICVPSSS